MKTVEFDIGNTVICDIRATAQDDEPFREFILRERGGNNKVTISSGDADEVDRMAADYKNHLGIEQ
jgi:hypothetical protein